MQRKSLEIFAGFSKELTKEGSFRDIAGMAGSALKFIGKRAILHPHKTFREAMALGSGLKFATKAGLTGSKVVKHAPKLYTSVMDVAAGLMPRKNNLGQNVGLKERLEDVGESVKTLGRSARGMKKAKDSIPGLKDSFESTKKNVLYALDPTQTPEHKFVAKVGKGMADAGKAVGSGLARAGKKSYEVGKVGAGGAIGMGVIGAGTIGYDALTRDPALLYNAGMGNTIRAGASWY